MSSTSTKKKFGFWKLLIWIVVIIVALNTISDGEFGDWLSSLLGGGSSYQPDPQQQEGYLGITVEEKTDVTGGCISRVEPGSSGANAGLLPGDIIVSIGGSAINNAADVEAQTSTFYAGDSTVFTVLREGQYITLEVVFGVKPQENTASTQATDPQESLPGETTPTNQNTPQIDRLPSVPEELRNHVYLGSRDRGYCEKLTGKVVVTVIFVSDPETAWTDGAIAQVQAELSDAVSRIRGDAAGYGAQVDLSLQYKTVSVSAMIVDGDETQWVDSALAAAGLPERSKINTGLEAVYGADAAPVVFVAGHGGRANAVRSSSGNEYAVLYENAHAFYHELSHIFGAEDFYYPNDVKKLAGTYLPNSIMVDSANGAMEDLTAYLIGWTDTLSQNAMNFLQATSYLTREYLVAEKEKESYTGYVTDYTYGGGSYTGYLIDGVKHGQGRWVREDGTVWEGTFHYGLFSGTGNIIYSGGDTYDGQWRDGKRHGTGTYKWADGSIYTGNFVENERTGKGTWTGINGNTYTGDFVDGEFHGYGAFAWSDGAKYSGEFQNGKRTGQGTMIYQNGGVYKGQWVDGDRHGHGTYTDPDGSVYTGQWVENVRSGQGTLNYANGNSYVGNWSDNTWNGQGTFCWTSGDKYTGAFVDGKRHGYGVYYYPNGNRYEGDWVNGERTGYGTMYYANGTSKTGTWNNGNFVG